MAAQREVEQSSTKLLERRQSDAQLSPPAPGAFSDANFVGPDVSGFSDAQLSPPARKAFSDASNTPQGEPPQRLSARERREAKFMARTDKELADEPKQVTAQMAALSARSPEVLERLMKNSGIHPKILQHGCKNKAATAETWNLAAQNMLTRMNRVPVTLGEEDANTAMAETAAYILGRDTPRNPLPPETAELAEKVWDQVSQRQDEWRLLKDDSLRQRGWIES